MKGKIREAIADAKNKTPPATPDRISVRWCALAYRLLLEEQQSRRDLGLPGCSLNTIANEVVIEYLGRRHK
jgi:hypothetical protein